MRRICFAIILSLIIGLPQAAFAYSGHTIKVSYGYHGGKHYGHHGYYKYGHRYRHGHHPYYYKKRYGHHYPYYRKPYYYAKRHYSGKKYHHLYKDKEGYSYFHSPVYGKIYCDHPHYRKYHDSSIAGNIKYYCGDKYAY